MNQRSHGQLRRGQLISTFGPGALIDLPNHSAIVGGLETWPKVGDLDEVVEPRLARKLESMTGVQGVQLYAPPVADGAPGVRAPGVGVWRFPLWFAVQETRDSADRQRSRRLVHFRSLDDSRRFEGLKVVPTRFVRACPKGHVSDLDWYGFVHGYGDDVRCRRQLWLDERGTSGDLGDLVVRCECGRSRGLVEAKQLELGPLGLCQGSRPWLGTDANEPCDQPSRLLIRTASNAYFPQVVSVLSIPDRGGQLEIVVRDLWDELQIVQAPQDLAFVKRKPRVTQGLQGYSDADVFAAIEAFRRGAGAERPVKEVELEAILAVPEGYGEDIPVDPNFHARRLPERVWRRESQHPLLDGVEAVYQLHRLREVLALVGFTRLESEMPDIHGEYDTDVTRADIAREPSWFPAVENRGEGIFLQLRATAVSQWMNRPAVKQRLLSLEQGHDSWAEDRDSKRDFPDGPYLLLHTLSHLLIQSLSMRCGYPASSIRERIYADLTRGRYGLLLYTGSPDAEGTLGGLVQQARSLQEHLVQALRMGALCSNDPICAHHEPAGGMERRWLHGAACHGCSLLAETSCEMRNEYLDRALVVPILGTTDASFFAAVP